MSGQGWQAQVGTMETFRGEGGKTAWAAALNNTAFLSGLECSVVSSPNSKGSFFVVFKAAGRFLAVKQCKAFAYD